MFNLYYMDYVFDTGALTSNLVSYIFQRSKEAPGCVHTHVYANVIRSRFNSFSILFFTPVKLTYTSAIVSDVWYNDSAILYISQCSSSTLNPLYVFHPSSFWQPPVSSLCLRVWFLFFFFWLFFLSFFICWCLVFIVASYGLLNFCGTNYNVFFIYNFVDLGLSFSSLVSLGKGFSVCFWFFQRTDP